jgi:hypothetical protein
MRARTLFVAAWLAAFGVPSLWAATYVVPSDAEMVQRADDIVIAIGVSSSTVRDVRGRIVTRFTLRVEESLKGSIAAGDEFMLTEPGGLLGDGGRIVFGAPRYETGRRYLVFTSTNRETERATFGMALGQFDLADGFALRHDIEGFDHNLEAHVEPVRDAPRFVQFIRDVVALRASSPDYFTSPPAVAMAAGEAALVGQTAATPRFSRSSYLLQTVGGGMRWRDPSADWVSNGTQPGVDGPAAVAKAIAQWNGTASTIRYRYAGVDNTAVGGLDVDDGKNAVLFNDPNDEIPDGSGIAGLAGSIIGAPYELDGESFRDILGGDVVIANVVIAQYQMSQAVVNTVVSHELGHTLGFRHADQPGHPWVCGNYPLPPSCEPGPPWVCGITSDCAAGAGAGAIMTFGAGGELDGVLSDWDRDAAATVYGDGACTLPKIVVQPQSTIVGSGRDVVLYLGAKSGRALHYSWYEGPRGDTSRPLGKDYYYLVRLTHPGSADPFPQADRSTSYWVRVTDVCGSVDSATAVITVPAARHRASSH